MTNIIFVFFRNVSEKELATIQKNKVIRIEEGYEQVPYKAILTDKSVWGIMASIIGAALGFNIVFMYGPVYLNQVLVTIHIFIDTTVTI